MKAAADIFNPFPGLRPFTLNEEKLFFGREGQSDIITEKFLKNKFVAIIGSSGSGKSSLVNAGIIPGLLRKGKQDAGSSWKIITSRPGKSPIGNLANVLAYEDPQEESEETGNIRHDEIVKLLTNNPLGLVDFLNQINNQGNKKILLVIDQFEDLFRSQRSLNNRTVMHEHERYITLLTETIKQENLPVYVLLVIRADFLEECQQFQELNFFINESNYILPKLKSEELEEVIHKPAAIGGAEIDAKLSLQLLNDIKDNKDYLPLLQHILSRMWEHWANEYNYDRPITNDDYEAVGKIEYAISKNADESFQELPDNKKLMCGRIFKVLTEKGTDNQYFSNPERISDIAFMTRVSVDDIIEIIERFRQPGRSFIKTYHEADLNSDAIVDLSHVSLIRLWSRLRNWVEEEAESVLMYRRLAEASRLYQMGKSELWTTPDIEQAIKWREINEPTLEWAQRYNTAFERTMQFLNRSQEAYEQEEEEKLEIPGKALRKARVLTVFAVLVVLISAGLTIHFSGLLSRTNTEPEMTFQEQVPAIGRMTDSNNLSAESINNDSVTLFQATETYDSQNQPETNTSRPEEATAPVTQRPVETPVIRPQSDIIQQRPAASVQVPSGVTQPSRAVEQPVRQTAAINREAQIAREEAEKRQMVAISQSLAVRSLQVDNDDDLKALLAFQAHSFNVTYNGSAYNPDIFEGLIASVKGLYGNSYNEYKGHSESVNSVIFRPNSNTFYSASSDGNILQWDLDDETRTPRTLAQNSVVNNKLAVSPNGQWLAVGTDGLGVQLLSPTRNLPNPYQISYGNNRVIALDFFPDNEHILFAGSDNSLVKHNIRSGINEIITVTDSEVMALAISPDGNMIAAGTRSGKVMVLRGSTNPVTQTLINDPGNDIHSVTFNWNGSRLAAGGVRGEIRVMDVLTGNILATLKGHSARVVDIAFSPDNRLVASSSFDGSIHIWNAQNLNARPFVIREHGSWVRTVAFNSGGDKLVSGSRLEARLKTWTTNLGEMASMICEKVSRNMTQAEWDQFIGGDIPYMESCPQLTGR